MKKANLSINFLSNIVRLKPKESFTLLTYTMGLWHLHPFLCLKIYILHNPKLPRKNIKTLTNQILWLSHLDPSKFSLQTPKVFKKVKILESLDHLLVTVFQNWHLIKEVKFQLELIRWISMKPKLKNSLLTKMRLPNLIQNEVFILTMFQCV